MTCLCVFYVCVTCPCVFVSDNGNDADHVARSTKSRLKRLVQSDEDSDSGYDHTHSNNNNSCQSSLVIGSSADH